MSASAIKVSEQLLQDNAGPYVSLINKYLDKQDAMLMLRALQDIDTDEEIEDDYDEESSEPLNYRNLLEKYLSLLNVISEKVLYKQKTLVQYLRKRKFVPLNDLIEAIPADLYDTVMARVQTTLASRRTYFVKLINLLQAAQCTPTQIAWFHRQIAPIISIYLKEHPDNKVLLKKESEQVKVICDLMAFKFGVYQKIYSICDLLRKSTSFFHSSYHHEAASYYTHILLSPLKDIANNRTRLTSLRPLMAELLSVYWDFEKKTNVFVTLLSYPAQEFIKTHKDKVIRPFFQDIFKIIESMEKAEELRDAEKAEEVEKVEEVEEEKNNLSLI